MNGLIYLDLIAALITAIIIVKVSIDIFLESIVKMLDKSCDENIIRQIEDLVISIDGVLGIDLIKSRLFGNKFYVDLEITANKDLSLENAHEIAHQVHDKVEEKISSVKHCMVHVNPK